MVDSKNEIPASLGQILIVDSDLHISDLLKYNLENEGYAVSTSTNVSDALDYDLTLFNLIISEVVLLEGPSGIRFAQMVKDNPDTAGVPIIFCSHRDSEDDIIAGFNAGADDYILKPFSLREMLARVRAVIRRHQILNRRQSASTTLCFKTLKIDLPSQSVTIDGEAVPVTRTEFQILSLFLKNRGKLFGRPEIFEIIRPGQEAGSERTIDVNISRLRKKLGQYAANLVNKSGQGYGFIE